MDINNVMLWVPRMYSMFCVGWVAWGHGPIYSWLPPHGAWPGYTHMKLFSIGRQSANHWQRHFQMVNSGTGGGKRRLGHCACVTWSTIIVATLFGERPP